MSKGEKRGWVLAALLLASFLGWRAIERLDAIEKKFDDAIAIAKTTQAQINTATSNSTTLVRQSDEALKKVGVLEQCLQQLQLDEHLRRWDAVAEEAHGVLTSSLFRVVFRQEKRR